MGSHALTPVCGWMSRPVRRFASMTACKAAAARYVGTRRCNGLQLDRQRYLEGVESHCMAGKPVMATPGSARPSFEALHAVEAVTTPGGTSRSKEGRPAEGPWSTDVALCTGLEVQSTGLT